MLNQLIDITELLAGIDLNLGVTEPIQLSGDENSTQPLPAGCATQSDVQAVAISGLHEYGQAEPVLNGLTRGPNLLYLDYDGVLHHHDVRRSRGGPFLNAPPGNFLFQHAALLEELLLPYLNTRLVLSTNWVRVLGYHRAAQYLPEGIRRRLIGATFHSRMDRGAFDGLPRGRQVVNDVLRRAPLDWVALDDDPEGWPDWSWDHFVQTNEVQGLSDPAVLARLRSRIANWT